MPAEESAEFKELWARLEEAPLAKARTVAALMVGGHLPGGEAASAAAMAAVDEAYGELLALQMKFSGLFGEGWLEIFVDLLKTIVEADEADA
jgi:hypothetical protein